jgi:hypothetical protein
MAAATKSEWVTLYLAASDHFALPRLIRTRNNHFVGTMRKQHANSGTKVHIRKTCTGEPMQSARRHPTIILTIYHRHNLSKNVNANDYLKRPCTQNGAVLWNHQDRFKPRKHDLLCSPHAFKRRGLWSYPGHHPQHEKVSGPPPHTAYIMSSACCYLGDDTVHNPQPMTSPTSSKLIGFFLSFMLEILTSKKMLNCRCASYTVYQLLFPWLKINAVLIAQGT